MTVLGNWSKAAALGLALTVTSASLAMSQSLRSVNGNSMSEQELLDALSTQPATGELTRSFTTRAIMPHDAKDVARESVYLNVRFRLNSAELDPGAIDQLATLAKVLKNPSIAEQSFGISGHTDASGSDGHNLDLSKRRAEAVKQYLHAYFGVDGSRLFINGQGESQLIEGIDPLSAENRRVEIVNLGKRAIEPPSRDVSGDNVQSRKAVTR